MVTDPATNSLSDIEQAVIEAGCAWIDDHEAQLIDLLTALVARPSLSGSEGTYDDPSTTVGCLWEFLTDHASDIDTIELDAQRIPPDGEYKDTTRDNIYAVLHGRDGGDDGLVCTSHTDIVPPGSNERWPGDDPYTIAEGTVRQIDDRTIEIAVDGERYERTIRGKMARIWDRREQEEAAVLIGRGGYDNKASIVCLVGSLLGLAAAIADPSTGSATEQESRDVSGLALDGDLIHGHLVDEEVYQIGVKNMVGWENGADWLGQRYQNPERFAGVILEGSYGFVPVIGHRGLAWITLTSNGKSAHGSTPELGRNAVVGIANALVDAESDDFLAAVSDLFIDDQLLGELTVAPGTTIVSSGIERVDQETGFVERSGMNSIPDWCEATFDVRIPRWRDFPENVTEMRQHLCDVVERRATAAVGGDAEVNFTAEIGEHGFFPPVALAETMEAAHTHPLVQTATWAARDTFSYEPTIEIAPGVTDAAFLYHGTHMPTLTEYGPAGALSHEPLEYVEREQVIGGAKAMLKLAVRHLGVFVSQRS